jgi:hypothetical protein
MRLKRAAVLAAVLTGWAATPALAAGRGADAAAQAYRDGLQAYVHAYPVVMHRLSQQSFPTNALVSIDALTKPADRLVVLPNVDTVYTVAKLDLRGGPLVLHVPDHGDRYFEFQLMDAYTSVAGYVGTRTTGPGPGDYAIAGPGDATPIPAGMTVLHSPTMDALLLGRTLVRSADELPALKGLLSQYALGPLGGEAKGSAVLDERPKVPRPAPPTGLAFFDLFDRILAEDPPTAAEAQALAPLAKYGIGPGLSASGAALTPGVKAALERAVRNGPAHIDRLVEQRRRRDIRRNAGWSAFDPKVGAFGNDWNLRAITAVVGLWANTADEAVYLIAGNDSQGRPLTGRHRYVLSFRTPPPARGFWSLTMYDRDRGLVDNAIGRQAVGDRSLGAGPVTIQLQHAAPKGTPASWLPAPRGAFTVALRLYVPEPAALDGSWRPPGIRCLDCR